jgi:DNA-binding MarR family transcriptional regulator
VNVPVVRMSTAPGHLLRRAQQVHTEIWARVVRDLTGPQYAVIVSVAGWDDVDQRRAGQLASLDKSTVADVVRRLAAKGWIERVRDDRDARRRVLTLSDRGRETLPTITRAAREVQSALLEPLEPAVRDTFVDLLGRVARIDEADVAQQAHEENLLVMRLTPGYLIRRAQQIHAAIWADRVRDVTGPQYAVLASIAGLGTADQAQIGTMASLDSSSTAEVVNRLGERGWLAKEPDPQDRRRVRIRLTGPAATAMRLLTGPVEQVQADVLSVLGPAERDTFVATLQVVAYHGEFPGNRVTAAPR